MFSTTDNPAHGVAAVTAINIAASQGQKIFTITQNNVDVALSQITLPPHVIQTIQDAVASGKEVTTHQMPIDFYGSPQVGYTVIDPQTGAGGYHIYGGEDGSETTSNNLSLSSGVLLAVTDTYSDARNPGGKPWFSETLKKVWRQGVLSKAVGYLGFGLEILMILFDEGLTMSQKMGQISTNLLSFAIGAHIVTAAVGFTGVLGVGGVVLIGMLVALALSVAITYINDVYFTRRLSFSRERYV